MTKWSKEDRKRELAARGGVLVTGLTANRGDILLARGKRVCDVCDEAEATTKVLGDDACAPCAEKFK